MNPARRPQDALRQRRDGVREYYYVEEETVFGGDGRAGLCRRHRYG